jgi:hypothetical protein
MAEGCGEDRGGRGGAFGLLGVPRRALGASSDDQPDRVRVCPGEGEDGGYERAGLKAGLAMIFKLMEAAEGRWRRLNAPHLVALVRAGAEFVNGELVEGSEEKDAA